MQHGHMEQVGYDTYCKLLDEVVKEMKGEPLLEEVEDIQIDLNITSYIPDEYIANGADKIEVYQNIALCRTEEDIENVIDDIIDRFGTLPEEVNNLIEIARIKNLCRKQNIIKISNKGSTIVITFEQNNPNIVDISDLIKKYKNQIKFSAGIRPMITLGIRENEDKQILNKINEFLKDCKAK